LENESKLSIHFLSQFLFLTGDKSYKWINAYKQDEKDRERARITGKSSRARKHLRGSVTPSAKGQYRPFRSWTEEVDDAAELQPLRADHRSCVAVLDPAVGDPELIYNWLVKAADGDFEDYCTKATGKSITTCYEYMKAFRHEQAQAQHSIKSRKDSAAVKTASPRKNHFASAGRGARANKVRSRSHRSINSTARRMSSAWCGKPASRNSCSRTFRRWTMTDAFICIFE
jgi:hypothetical protein